MCIDDVDVRKSIDACADRSMGWKEAQLSSLMEISTREAVTGLGPMDGL